MNEVFISGIDIKFSNLMFFLIKLSIAAVPAAIIVFIFWTLILGIVGGFLAMIGSGL